MNLFKSFRILLAVAGVLPVFLCPTAAQIVIHVQHPWAQDDPERATTPLYIASEEPGWYPGKVMTSEGGNWFSYTFVNTTKTSAQRIELMSVIPTVNDAMANRLTYPPSTLPQMTMRSIFEDNQQANEVWITFPTPSSAPIIHFTPPPSKMILFFNPWEIGFPLADIKKLTTVRMRKIPEYCGWFAYNYFASLDSIQVRMINSKDKSLQYTVNGIAKGGYIDLTAALDTSDTVWIIPEPLPDGPPIISREFPGITGDCGMITLAVTLRDKGYGPDFGIVNCDGGENITPGMVQPRLGADGKPVKTKGACQTDSFPKWFVAENLSNGYTNEICYNITLEKNEDGLYEYDSDAFFPLDSFLYLDDARKVKNPNYTLDKASDGQQHNFWFTMELTASFEYVKGQTFYFRGDDDVWVFIDSQLAVDLGGLHMAAAGSVRLDNLRLKAGQTYNFKLFFAERKCCDSNFRIVTSIDLRSSSNLFYDKDSSSSVIKYYMKSKRTKSDLTCDSDGEIVDTVNAEVVYYIEGPSFPTPFLLKPGKHYGDSTLDKYGIVIISSKDSSVLKLDTASFVGVLAGDYVIKYYSAKDRSQQGSIPFHIFEVPKPPRVPNSIVNAAYFADNPNGQVNRAEIYFKNTPSIIPDSIQLFWPNSNTGRTIRKEGLTIDKSNSKHFTINLTKPFDPEITTFYGSNQLGYCYSFDTSFYDPQETLPIRFADSVGPLLKEAIVMERVGTARDTFLLTFTEPIRANSISGQSLRLIKANGKYLTDISFIQLRGDTVVATVTLQDNLRPLPGDSLQIVSTGPIVDVYENHARIDNRPVQIKIRKSPANIVKSFYRDRNADGTVDEAQIEFDRDVDITDVSSVFTWVNGLSTDTLNDKKIRSGEKGSVILVNLYQAFNKSTANITSEKMSVHVKYKQFPSAQSNLLVDDSAAPVIVSAIFATGISDMETNLEPDTLYVKFSEEIKSISTDLPLKFRKPGSASDYKVTLQFLRFRGTEHVFKVLSTEIYPEVSDSVWINPEGNIEDLVTNKQCNPLNTRVLLKFRPTPLKFRYRVGPNPFDPGKELVTITVDPAAKTRESVNIQATVRIYDPMGNKIYSDIQKSATSKSPELKIKWNGENLNGREVSSGTYMIIIKAEDLNGSKVETKRLFVGVKKR
ncbi:MAG TPA: fibro-slime domain-containing protein [Chitinispirillaceae bacterium]|nr:fibro-slime domain-containing protein [Chitinispirillaceae bacterium]